MPTYLSADGWVHIFLEYPAGAEPLEVERTCRLVLDSNDLRLLRADVEHGNMFIRATSFEADDLLDSLLHGNPCLLDEPERCGLECGNELPAWCGVTLPSTTRTTVT
jgi:hypothetical protein